MKEKYEYVHNQYNHHGNGTQINGGTFQTITIYEEADREEPHVVNVAAKETVTGKKIIKQLAKREGMNEGQFIRYWFEFYRKFYPNHKKMMEKSDLINELMENGPFMEMVEYVLAKDKIEKKSR